MRKLGASINKTKTIAIFINQLREKVGVMFGNPETTPGGRALKFYASVRLDVRRKYSNQGTGTKKIPTLVRNQDQGCEEQGSSTVQRSHG